MEMNLENETEANFKYEYESQRRLSIINWRWNMILRGQLIITIKLASPKSPCCKMWEEIFCMKTNCCKSNSVLKTQIFFLDS